MAKRKFFGTDGVRGRVGKSPMTPDFLVKLGFAAGRVLAGRGEPTVLIGKDTRLSGYLVESALEAGFAAAGVDVILSGPLPTAAVSYLTQALRLSAGIVVSASHNPHHDNGVKFFGADGEKLPDAVEAQIEEKLRDLRDLSFAGRPGRARRLDDAVGRYIEFCKRAFPARLSLRGVKIVVDCANGAAYHCAPAIFHELGAEVETIGCEPDGENINVGCGALCPRPAARLVKKIGADCGVVLDGDADRVLLIDAAGRVLDGDCLLWILCGEEARRGRKTDRHRRHRTFERRARIGARQKRNRLRARARRRPLCDRTFAREKLAHRRRAGRTFDSARFLPDRRRRHRRFARAVGARPNRQNAGRTRRRL